MIFAFVKKTSQTGLSEICSGVIWAAACRKTPAAAARHTGRTAKILIFPMTPPSISTGLSDDPITDRDRIVMREICTMFSSPDPNPAVALSPPGFPFGKIIGCMMNVCQVRGHC